MSDTAEHDPKMIPLTDVALGDHPMWQAFVEQMAINRQADIAEANRLADLEEMAGGADTMNTSIKANGSTVSADAGWPVPEFKHNLGDNPLWDEFMEEMKKNRQADIAEANRLADLELEQQG